MWQVTPAGDCARRHSRSHSARVNDDLGRLRNCSPNTTRKEASQRAPRLVLERPLKYRVADVAEWQHGTLVNISSSGLLFRCREEFQVGAELEVNVAMEFPALATASNLRCGCVVVRVEAGKDETCAVGARITTHDLLPTAAAGGA